LGLAREGADLVVNYASNAEAARQVAEEAELFGVRAFVVQADMNSDTAPRELFDQCIAKLGKIDILVLNVSKQLRKPWSEVTAEEFDIQMRVNFRSTMQLTQLVLPGMIERHWGRIVTIGSVQQIKPHPQMIVYAASKSAMVNMVRNLAKQVGPYGVTVNNLAPGVILTDRNEDALSDPVYRERVLESIPMRAFGEPDDCVGAALLLCSEAGRYITGVDLLVDGGMQL
jgi:NAD(P)-dependent dehydrogenase (short-subunit alcohol dehydrogenase family)